MNKLLVAIVLVATVVVPSQRAVTQPPLPAFQNGGNLARLPNDQVEGAIWEYSGTPKSRPKPGEEMPDIAGTLRVEGTAVYEVERRIKLPGKKEVKEVVEAIRSGEGREIKLPGGSKPKRIGQFSPLSHGRVRFELNDGKDLQGVIVAQPKNRTADVLIGEYTEMDGKKKTGRQWQVELRPIED